MKISIKNYACLLLVPGMLLINACDSGFEDVNVNPDAISKATPEYIFSKALYDGVRFSGNEGSVLLGTMQYLTSFNDVAGFGSKYVAAQVSQTYRAFNNSYPNQINELGEVIRAVKDDPAKANLLHIARIWRVFCFARITDLYGDVPYFEAGEGYSSGNYQPKYTPQREIYADMLKELEEATAALNASGASYGAADLIYAGNTDQWKKFGYSLMLRLGMRLTGVAPDQAEAWVTKAIAGGVIINDADIAKINYLSAGQEINRNPIALSLWNADYIAQNGNSNVEGGKYQKSFIDSLKSNNDPRLPVLAIVWVGGVANDDPDIQMGMPADLPNLKPSNFVEFSEPKPGTVLRQASPLLLFTTMETNFLLAEAALRGWYNASTPETLFENGIRAAMEQWDLISGADGIIDPDDIDDYVAEHPLTSVVNPADIETQLSQIYTQFWLGAFPDAQEVFNHYRRTGHPALQPNNYAGNATSGVFPRRFMYPVAEQTLNAASYKEAIDRQGPDDLLTRVWWDNE